MATCCLYRRHAYLNLDYQILPFERESSCLQNANWANTDGVAVSSNGFCVRTKFAQAHIKVFARGVRLAVLSVSRRLFSMGNCLSTQTADDLSPLNESEGATSSRELPPPYQEGVHQTEPMFHLAANQTREAFQLSEEEQVRTAQRLGIIAHLPKGLFQPSDQHLDKRSKECAICMMDFEFGEAVRFLPCLHTYHVDCIDAWLMRSLTCPSCLEPVDAALLSTYQTN